MDEVRKHPERGYQILDTLHRQSLDKLLADFGIKGLSEADLKHINLGWHRLKPWPDCGGRADAAEVEVHHRAAVQWQRRAADQDGEEWRYSLGRGLVGSDLFGHFKPDPETYLGVAKLLDLEPGQVMLGAAHNNDLANGAQMTG